MDRYVHPHSRRVVEHGVPRYHLHGLSVGMSLGLLFGSCGLHLRSLGRLLRLALCLGLLLSLLLSLRLCLLILLGVLCLMHRRQQRLILRHRGHPRHIVLVRSRVVVHLLRLHLLNRSGLLRVLPGNDARLLGRRHRRPRSLWGVPAEWTRPSDVPGELSILYHRTPNSGIDVSRCSVWHDTLGLRGLPVPSGDSSCLSLKLLLLVGVEMHLMLLICSHLRGLRPLVTGHRHEGDGRTIPAYLLREPRRLTEEVYRRDRRLE